MAPRPRTVVPFRAKLLLFLTAAVLAAGPAWSQGQRLEAARQNLSQTVEKAEQAYSFTRNILQELQRLDPDAPVVEPAALVSKAGAQLEQARAVAADAGAELSQVQQSDREMVTLAGDLQRVRQDLLAAVQRVKRQQRDLLESIRGRTARGVQLLDQAGAVSWREAAALRKLLDATPFVDESAPLTSLRGTLDKLEAAIKEFQARQATESAKHDGGPSADASPAGGLGGAVDDGGAPDDAPPPPALVQAVEALFRADYPKALDLLGDVPPESPRVELARKLLEAAASYALYLRNGKQDPQLLADAESAADRCHELAPSLDLEGLGLSPVFLDFYSSRQPAPSAPGH